MENSNILFKSALEAMKNAYAPYSAFKVGAAIEAEDGLIYQGCNVENVSFPCGTCAEAGAIAAMNVAGNRRIVQMVVVSQSDRLITPCGACLQRILEFSDKKTLIHLADLNGIQKTYVLSDLLPVAFYEEGLKK